MAATMSAVAKAAGVSIATVSFVVNDTKPVAPQTRARVEQAMKDLGFRRNVVARALASKRTRIVALVYPILEHPMSGNTHEFITGAARAAREADHHLVIWPTSNDADELVELVGQRLVDGVLLMEVQLDDARVEALRALDLPFALIGRPRKVRGLWCVDADFTASMRIAMNHLTDLGHRNIALVNGSQSQAAYAAYGPFVRSETAYRKLASAQGIKPVVEYSEQSVQAGRKTAAQLLLTAPDTTAVIALYVLAAAGDGRTPQARARCTSRHLRHLNLCLTGDRRHGQPGHDDRDGRRHRTRAPWSQGPPRAAQRPHSSPPAPAAGRCPSDRRLHSTRSRWPPRPSRGGSLTGPGAECTVHETQGGSPELHDDAEPRAAVDE